MIHRLIRRASRTCNFSVYEEAKPNSRKNPFLTKCKAYENEYFYKNDKNHFKLLKEKTLEQIKLMQEEIHTMRAKIEDYNSEIRENLRFLKNLENEIYAKDNKKVSKE